MKNIKNKKLYLTAIVCSLAVYALIAKHDEIKTEIINTCIMWCTILVPSLFPYLVISGYICSSGAMNITPEILLKPLQKLIKTSKSATMVYLCSLFCGYPSGALCTSELYKKSLISKSEAERLICFTNNAGPLFVVSAIGTSMLGNTSDGIALYAIQMLSALFYALFSKPAAPMESKYLPAESSDGKADFCACVKNAVSAIINIGAFVVVTAVACRIIIIFAVSIFNIKNYKSIFLLETYIYSLFEISKASGMISLLPKSEISFAILCAAISWSGISVVLQVKSALPEEIGIGRFIRAKAIQSALSFSTGYLYKAAIPEKHFYLDSGIIFASLILSAAIFISYISATKKLR